jgi:hypothetical protein
MSPLENDCKARITSRAVIFDIWQAVVHQWREWYPVEMSQQQTSSGDGKGSYTE